MLFVSPRIPSALLACVVLASSLLSPAVITAAEDRIEIELGLRAVDLHDQGTPGSSRLTFEGAHPLRDFGRPQLPMKVVELLIPRDRSVTAVRLEGGREVSLGVPRGLALDAGEVAPGVPRVRPEMFSSDLVEAAALYPPVAAEPGSDHFLHGHHLVGVRVYPVRQHRETGELFLRVGARLVVELGPRTDRRVVVDRLRASPRWRAAVEDALALRISNPWALASHPLPPTMVADELRPAHAEKTPSLGTSPVQFLIVTSAQMAPQFQRLADHRTALGMPALVVTVDQILANYRHGLDLTETIRMYIVDAYSKWGVDYVLLGGDSGIIPPRYLNSVSYPPGGSTDIPADIYFSGLDGNWNGDGDAIFGEPERLPFDPGDMNDLAVEVAVGRAPVSDLAEAQLFVDKILSYELPTDTSYQVRALFASEVLFPEDWGSGDDITLDGAGFSEDLTDIITPCDTYASWDPVKFYQNHTAFPGSLPEMQSDVLDSLSTGDFGVFHHIGHGFYFNMSVGDDNIRVVNADAQQNTGNPYWIYALNCSSSAFDFNCLMERFIRNPQGGSVATFGSSRAAFPHTAHRFQKEFYDALMCRGYQRAGDTLAQSRIPFIASSAGPTLDLWTHFVYTLLGDPSMPLWSSRPRELALGPPASAQLGDNALLITVTDVATSLPYEGVTVALTKDDEDYAVGTTDAAGQVSLDFAPETLGDITLWASGRNSRPQSLTIPVLDPVAPHLAVTSLAFSDDGVGASLGNGNGRLEPGERIEITPVLINGGTAAFPGGTVTLQTADTHLTLVTSTVPVGAIDPGLTSPVSSPLVVDLATTLPDGHEVILTLVTDDGGAQSWSDEEVVLFSAGELEVLQLRWDDSVFGNGNGVIEVDEEVEVIVQLKNFGDGAVGAVSGTLTSTSPNVTILDPTANWLDLPTPLSTRDNDGDRLRVSESDVGTTNVFDLTLTDDVGRVTMVSFDLRAPAQVQEVEQAVSSSGAIALQWELGFELDLLGYRVYRKAPGDPAFAPATPDIIQGGTYFIDTGLPPLTAFEYTVAAVDQGGLEGPVSTVLNASTAPPEIGCFPLSIEQETSGALAMWHLDADGVLDMVIGSDLVYVIDGLCQEKLDGDANSQTLGPIHGQVGKYDPASITLGNLDSDPEMEIVASEWDTDQLYVLNPDGSVLPGWPVQLSGQNWGTPALGDLDGDGDNEIVVLNTTGRLYAFHHDGTEVADGDANPATLGLIAPPRAESFGRTSPALYDVDNDGQLEILFGSKYQNNSINEEFYAYNADGSGTHAAGWPQLLPPRFEFLASPTIADIDNDGDVEILQVCEGDSMYVWNPDGTPQAPWPLPFQSSAINKNSVAPSVAVGDFTGDGFLEMVICEVLFNTTIRVNLVDHLGNLLPGWPIIVENLSEGSPVVGDITGDGSLDIVFGVGGGLESQKNFLHAWHMDATPVDGFPIFLTGFARATPTLGDFDGDGSINILLASWDKLIHVWDMGTPYVEALVPWPTFRGNVHRDGVLGTVVPEPVPPEALANVTGNQPTTDNPPGGVTDIQVSWSGAEPGATVRVFRKGFGGYPEYDDAGGTEPPLPADPDAALAEGWTEVAATTGTAVTDSPGSRDFWYHMAFVTDQFGNVSTVSNRTDGALSYHLGDVSDGVTPGVGNNQVSTEDISFLGDHYGVDSQSPSFEALLDIGPTVGGGISGRPTTDDWIDFEDLIVFAINFDAVSKQDPDLPPATRNAVSLAPQWVEGSEWLDVPVQMSGDGQVQGLSLRVSWDPQEVEWGRATKGPLLAAQNGGQVVLSPEPGLVDVALLGARDRGISGEGSPLTLHFRRLGAGDPRIRLTSVLARNADNAAVEVDLDGSSPGPDGIRLPSLSTLHPVSPNPFNPTTAAMFDVAQPGPVSLRVYTVGGRLARSLVDRPLPAGRHVVRWDGRDERGDRMASGVYFLRMDALDRTQTQRVVLLK